MPTLDEMKFDEEQYRKGRDLRDTVITPGWKVILEIIKSYAQQPLDKLAVTEVSNRDEALNLHAEAFAATKLYNRFIEDVQQLIDFSQNHPDADGF